MRWSETGGKSPRRDDVYRVDRELARMKFFAGEALEKNTRTKFENSHQVYIEDGWIKFQLYKTVIAERNLVTNALKFRHGGWPTLETSKDLDPIFTRYFGNHLTMYRDQNEYWIQRKDQGGYRIGQRIRVGAEGVSITPKDFGVYEFVDQDGNRYVWDLTVQRAV